jgi:hypothetical protein
MGYHIDDVLSSAPLWELDLLGPCIQHRIGTSRPPQDSIKFLRATTHPSSTYIIPNWNLHAGANILVTIVDIILYATGAILIPVGIRHVLIGNMVILVGLMVWHIEVGVSN